MPEPNPHNTDKPAPDTDNRWYVLRDLKRPNSLTPAYKTLADMGFEVFTPMRWVLRTLGGRQVRSHEPAVRDMVFVNARRSDLDPVIQRTPTLQYRYVHGAPYREPLTVPLRQMQQFMAATAAADAPRFLAPEEITPAMRGRRIRITDGPLAGCEGTLLTVRGSRVRRLMVELPGILAVAVEVEPQYIEFLDSQQ